MSAAGRPADRPSDDDAYYAQLRREAQDFLNGRSRAGGEALYRELQRAVARYLLRRDELPDPDDPRPLPKRAGRGQDGFRAQAAWDLLHDYVSYHLFAPGDARIFVAFHLGRDLRGFRHWLVEELRRYITIRIQDDESARMRDNVLKGLGRALSKRDLALWGRKPARYWSECERSPGDVGRILSRLDIECALDVALREIDEQTTTLEEHRDTRLTSGWGPGERRKIAGILTARLSVELPELGRATFIPEPPLKAMLTRLIHDAFPELFTEPLYVPLGDDEHAGSGEEREADGVRHAQAMDAIGATDAALEIMETLTFASPPKRPGGTSGADVKRAVRLYFDGARSTREGEDAWRAEPSERRGKRPITAASLMECMPGDPQGQPPGQLLARLQALGQAFDVAPAGSKPRSHVTVNALRERCWLLWKDACVDLDPVAEALALHWFVDLLFLEVGRDTPFSSIDAAALALVDRRAAERAAQSALSKLRLKAGKAGFEQLPTAIRSALDGAGDDVIAERLDISLAEGARLRLTGRTVIESVLQTHRLLPNQWAMAESILADALGRRDGGSPRAGRIEE